MRIQELRARMWAYDRQIGRIGIIRCFEAGCQSQSEMAEFWDVTEEFMIILSVAGFSACGGSRKRHLPFRRSTILAERFYVIGKQFPMT